MVMASNCCVCGQNLSSSANQPTKLIKTTQPEMFAQESLSVRQDAQVQPFFHPRAALNSLMLVSIAVGFVERRRRWDGQSGDFVKRFLSRLMPEGACGNTR